jgi:hypothetical protein
MKKIILIVSTIVFMIVVSSAPGGQKTKGTSMNHTEWVGNALKEIQTIKVGMTRKDLLRLFVAEGGLGGSGRSRTYLYRDCIYIKVDVEFQPTQQSGGKLRESPDDKIVEISRPYLGNPTID